jgi:phosphoribosyl-ATP pyrophosphohydrolase
VYVNYEGSSITIQTPLVRLPYGIGDWNEKNAEGKPSGEDKPKKYDLNFSFDGMDSNPKIKELLDKMNEIEKKITEDAFENRLAWLDDDYDGIKSVVSKLFTPIVKYDKDKVTKKVVNKYPPTVKCKLPYDTRSDIFTFVSQDMNGEEIEFKTIMRNLKGAKARLIIQLSGIWIAGGRYGCTWKVVRGRFEVTKPNVVDFVEDSDVEVADEDAVKPEQLREPTTAPDRRIVLTGVRGARVQHHPTHRWTILVPTSP